MTPDCSRFAPSGFRFLLLLALGVAACKAEVGGSERTIAEPSTASDGAVAARPDAGTGLPPFTLPAFPRRDAGAVAPPQDAGVAPTPLAPVIETVGPAGDLLVAGNIALEVPEGAVTRQLEITFAALASPPPGFVGQAWLISPPTTRFAKPVKLAILLDASLLAQAPGTEWVVSTLVNGAWVPLSNTGNDPGDVITFGFTDVLGPFALTRRVPSEADVLDAALPDDAATAQDASVESATDAGVEAEGDAALPVPICTQGACANGACIQGATNYACMCSPGFAAAADQQQLRGYRPVCERDVQRAEHVRGRCVHAAPDPCAAVVAPPTTIARAAPAMRLAQTCAAAQASTSAPPSRRTAPPIRPASER